MAPGDVAGLSRHGLGHEVPTSAVDLKAACGPRWEQATRHAFVRELAADTLDDDVFRAYLVQDHLFIDALVRLVAHAVTVAPGRTEERRLADFFTVLVSDENDYFERAFDALGVTAATRAAARKDEVTLAFEDLFLAARAEGTYAAAIGALAPVEWVYLDWATWTEQEGERSPRFWLSEWVDLHTGEAFATFVAWLCTELDGHAPTLALEAQERLAARFVRAVDLETAFWSGAYLEHGQATPRARTPAAKL